ncbi:MAG: ABC transporter permease [Flavobacteriales bacterium]|nr:ABC transporter permease [Flavobacteriales bacterium]
MIPKIAWRNIWRNRLRSFVVIGAIIMGIWAGIFMSSLSIGMTETRTQDILDTFISHVQVHDSTFVYDHKPADFIQNFEEVYGILQNDDSVTAITRRVIYSQAMLASAKGNRSVEIRGIYPEEERGITKLHEYIVDGNFFEEFKGKPVCIGAKIAEKNGYEVGDKLILQYQDIHGEMHAVKYKVCGIFKTINSQHDGFTVYVPAQTLFDETGDIMYHEIALRTFNKSDALSLSNSLQAQLPDVKVEYWGQVSPDLGYTDEMMGVALLIYMGIIMLALMFGIINTMLMAVLERTRELGMLMAVGMTKPKVFLMIVLETLFLSIVGGPLGILLGHLTVGYFGTNGLDLSVVAEGMSLFGMSSIVYTSIDPSAYIQIGIMVVVTALLAALYPARKALKLNPSEAIRSI